MCFLCTFMLVPLFCSLNTSNVGLDSCELRQIGSTLAIFSNSNWNFEGVSAVTDRLEGLFNLHYTLLLCPCHKINCSIFMNLKVQPFTCCSTEPFLDGLRLCVIMSAPSYLYLKLWGVGSQQSKLHTRRVDQLCIKLKSLQFSELKPCTQVPGKMTEESRQCYEKTMLLCLSVIVISPFMSLSNLSFVK